MIGLILDDFKETKVNKRRQRALKAAFRAMIGRDPYKCEETDRIPVAGGFQVTLSASEWRRLKKMGATTELQKVLK